MRILLVADLHYSLPHVDWVASVSDRFDVVALAGDHLDVASAVDIDTQIVALRPSFADIARRTNLLIASGNHDLNIRDAHGEKSTDWLDVLRDSGAVVDGDTTEIDGTLATVIGWWDGPVAQAAVDQQLADVARAGRPWIWIYHSPPHGPLSWTGSRHYGDPVVTRWIERWQPTAVLMGHIHQAPFTPDGSWIDRFGSTLLLNAGKQIGPVPAHIELDLQGGVARWTSYDGVDERQLADLETAD